MDDLIIIYVKWQDHHSACFEWTSVSDIVANLYSHDASICASCGFLVHETDTWLTLALNTAFHPEGNDYAKCIHIFKPAILEKRELS